MKVLSRRFKSAKSPGALTRQVLGASAKVLFGGVIIVTAGSALAANGSLSTVQPIATINGLSSPAQCAPPYFSAYGASVQPTSNGVSVSMSNSATSWGINIPNVSKVNFAQAGAVAVDVTNPTAYPETFRFAVIDSSNGNLQNVVQIPANTTETIAMVLYSGNSVTQFGLLNLPAAYANLVQIQPYSGGNLNTQSVASVNFYSVANTQATNLQLSNVRLLPVINWTTFLTGSIDAYGQTTLSTWPTQLTNPSQFASRAAAEEASYTNLLGNTVDAYGGSLLLPHQTATGHFRTAKVNGKWWLVTPAGNLFFMNGVDQVWPQSLGTVVSGRNSMFQSLPGSSDPLAQNYGTSSEGTTYNFYTANLQRKYGSNWQPSFLNSVKNRMSTWGLNTLGSFSDEIQSQAGLPYVKKLTIAGNYNTVATATGNDQWGPIEDPYDPQFKAAVVQLAQSMQAISLTDPNLIGFVVDSEPSWQAQTGSATDSYSLSLGVLQQNSASSPAKTALVKYLQSKYARINLLNAAWNTHFSSFAALGSSFTANNPTGAMSRDLTQFLGNYAFQYFSTIRAAFKQYCPNTLYFGCSFAGATATQVVSAAAVNADVLAFNIYAPTVSSVTGVTSVTSQFDMPAVVTEFGFDSTSDGIYGAFEPVSNQATRAAAYTAYMNDIVTQTQWVGCNFYMFTDEPTSGCPGTGANNNQGLVDITDTPYPQMISAIQSVAQSLYQTRWSG